MNRMSELKRRIRSLEVELQKEKAAAEPTIAKNATAHFIGEDGSEVLEPMTTELIHLPGQTYKLSLDVNIEHEVNRVVLIFDNGMRYVNYEVGQARKGYNMAFDAEINVSDAVVPSVDFSEV